MAFLNKQIILRQALSGKQITIDITNSNYIDIIKEEISKINNTNVYNLIINKDIYLCFELDKIQYDNILDLQIINIVFLNILLVDIIKFKIIDRLYIYSQNEQDMLYNLNNLNLIIYLITQNLLIFKYVNSDIKNNFEIVKLVVQIYGLFLEYASDE